MSSENRKPSIHVAWTTITYRSVALLILAGVAIFGVAVRFTFVISVATIVPSMSVTPDPKP